MQRDGIADVVVMHPHYPMRMMLQRKLAQTGYRVTVAPTYTAVLRRLRKATARMVVVAGNMEADFFPEVEFFWSIGHDGKLARRHRFVLFCALPEWIPEDLYAVLCGLDVFVLSVPTLPQLLDAVAQAAGRAQAEQAEDASAG
jgi:hypothetical protein